MKTLALLLLLTLPGCLGVLDLANLSYQALTLAIDLAPEPDTEENENEKLRIMYRAKRRILIRS